MGKKIKTDPPDCSARSGDMSCFLNVTPNIENDVKNFFGTQKPLLTLEQ